MSLLRWCPLSTYVLTTTHKICNHTVRYKVAKHGWIHAVYITLYTGHENTSCFTKIRDLLISDRAKTEKQLLINQTYEQNTLLTPSELQKHITMDRLYIPTFKVDSEQNITYN